MDGDGSGHGAAKDRDELGIYAGRECRIEPLARCAREDQQAESAMGKIAKSAGQALT